MRDQSAWHCCVTYFLYQIPKYNSTTFEAGWTLIKMSRNLSRRKLQKPHETNSCRNSTGSRPGARKGIKTCRGQGMLYRAGLLADQTSKRDWKNDSTLVNNWQSTVRALISTNSEWVSAPRARRGDQPQEIYNTTSPGLRRLGEYAGGNLLTIITKESVYTHGAV